MRPGRQDNKEPVQRLRTDTRMKERKVWLVKVPSFLRDAFARAGSNDTVGTITLSSDPDTKEKKIELEVDQGRSEFKDMPAKYRLNALSGGAPAHVIAAASNHAAVLGRVMQNYTAQVARTDDSYRGIARARRDVSEEKKRATQQIEGYQARHSGSRILSTSEVLAITRDRRKRLASARTKSNMEKEQVRDVVFGAFSKTEAWKLASLVQATGLSPAELKPVMNEVCDLVRAGPSRGHYMLKPEYRIDEPEPKG